MIICLNSVYYSDSIGEHNLILKHQISKIIVYNGRNTIFYRLLLDLRPHLTQFLYLHCQYIQFQIHFLYLQQIQSQKSSKLMSIINKVKHLVKVADFFYSTEMLRYDDDLEYKTLTGGIVSLGIIITIIVGFASMILNTLDLNTFNTSTQIIKNAVPPASVLEISQTSPFRFGVQIYSLNLSSTKRFFDVNFYLLQYSYGQVISKKDLTLQVCTHQFFKDYSSIVDNFQQLQVGNWLCPSLNTTMNMFGKYSSATYNQYVIQVSACNNDTDPSRPCASTEQIQSYMVQNKNFFYFTIYFTNTQINPDKKNYKQYYIEDQSYAIFGSNLGTETFLYFTDYTVSTDYSIWPFTNVVNDIGCLVEDLAVNHPFQTTINNTFINFNIAKSTNSILYTRQVQKLSAVFSFMGGMIGAVSAVLFVIKIYTSLSFQFSIALEIFKKKSRNTINKIIIKENSNEQNQDVKTDKEYDFSMNFFNFIRYYLYGFLETVGCKCRWPQMEYAKECKQQILKQLDVKLLLKRIIFLEHCLTYLIDDFQLDSLQFQKPQTPHQIRNLRQKCSSIVDYQLYEQNDIIEQRILKECKNQEVDPSSIETPMSLSSSVSHNSQKIRNSLDKESPSRSQLIKNAKNTKNNSKNKQIMMVDIQNIHQENLDPVITQEVFSKAPEIVKKNKVKDTFRRQKVRESFLIQLSKHVETGNEVSFKIWNSLDPKTRNSITQLKNANIM